MGGRVPIPTLLKCEGLRGLVGLGEAHMVWLA